MLYNRNHRNLLFLRHSFRTYHSLKTNNNAKCCLLLDNLANKKCILIQSRELRFKVSNISSENNSSNSADDENGAEKSSRMSPQQFLSKFESKFSDEYGKKYSGLNFLLPWNLRVFIDHHYGHKQFVDKFNKEHAKCGYKIEWDGKAFRKFALIWMITITFAGFVGSYLILSIPLHSSLIDNMQPEHGQIVAQPPIKFDQLLQDYLPSGEIDKIIHYPQKKLLVVLIHPGALINGEPYNGPGLHVKLDAFLMPDQLFQRILEEERRIGVRTQSQFLIVAMLNSAATST